MNPSHRKWILFVVAIAALALIGWVDRSTGPDIGFSLFYALPVLVSGFYVGRRAAVVSAAFAAMVWFGADYAVRGSSWLPVSVWNGFTRLAIFVVLGIFSANQRRHSQALAEVNGSLAQALAREEQLSRTDALTGLANARAFLETLRRELERSRRSGTALCVAYLDLDNFKRVNDTLGHRGGDELLRSVAAALREEVRGGDVPARLGGDEFAVLLWDAKRGEVERIGERLLRRVATFGEAMPEVQLGASVGIAWFDQPPTSEDVVIRAADEAMYRAKAAGKNRVMLEVRVASELPAGESP